MTPPTDETLLAEYYACDPKAFATLWFGQKQPRRVGYMVRLNRYLAKAFPKIRETDREDLVNNVGLIVAQSKQQKSFDSNKKFRPWVFQIARNQAVDFLKKKSNQEITGEESEPGVPINPADNRNPSAVGFEDETVEKAYVAIDRLPAEEREVFLLRLNGLSNQEAALILDISEPVSSTRFQKALQKMENVLKDHVPDESESMNPISERFFKRLQERHEYELTLAFERMKRRYAGSSSASSAMKTRRT